MMGARDVAGAAGAGADPRGGLDHGADHFRVLAHAEIVVGAPDHDIARALRRVPDRMRETACDPFKVGKNAVAPLVMQAVEGGTEKFAVIHHKDLEPEPAGLASRLFRAFPALLSMRIPTFRRPPGCHQRGANVDRDQGASCASWSCERVALLPAPEMPALPPVPPPRPRADPVQRSRIRDPEGAAGPLRHREHAGH